MGKKRKPKDLKLQMVWTQVQDAHGRALASNAKGEEHFNGFITPEGEISAVHDTGKVFSMLVKLWGRKYKIAPFLRYLAEKCTDSGHFTAAYDYLGKVLFLVDAPIEKEGCLLGMGQVMERSGDYEAAREAYLGAFELPQEPGEVWYLLNNNLGYCLNQAGQCQEAERYCRAAIEIDPGRHNAHKNLGIAQQSQGQYADAAKSFMHGTQLCPADPRALAHLEDLIAKSS